MTTYQTVKKHCGPDRVPVLVQDDVVYMFVIKGDLLDYLWDNPDSLTVLDISDEVLTLTNP